MLETAIEEHAKSGLNLPKKLTNPETEDIDCDFYLPEKLRDKIESLATAAEDMDIFNESNEISGPARNTRLQSKLNTYPGKSDSNYTICVSDDEMEIDSDNN